MIKDGYKAVHTMYRGYTQSLRTMNATANIRKSTFAAYDNRSPNYYQQGGVQVGSPSICIAWLAPAAGQQGRGGA